MAEQTSSASDAPEWDLEQRGRLRLVGTALYIEYNPTRRRMDIVQGRDVIESHTSLADAKATAEQFAADLREMGIKP